MSDVRRFYFQPAQRRMSFAGIAIAVTLGKLTGFLHSPLWFVAGWILLAAAMTLPTTVVSASGLLSLYRGYRLIRWSEVREIHEPGVWASMPTAELGNDKMIKLVGVPPEAAAELDESRAERSGTT